MLTKEIRDELIADLAALRKGEITVAQAKARALLARNILESLKIDLVAQRMAIGDLGSIATPRLQLVA